MLDSTTAAFAGAVCSIGAKSINAVRSVLLILGEDWCCRAEEESQVSKKSVI
jgi:hypothetical protein